MGPEFFQTMMGQRYYEGTMPRIAKALERIADQLEKGNADVLKNVKPTELLTIEAVEALENLVDRDLIKDKDGDHYQEILEILRRE